MRRPLAPCEHADPFEQNGAPSMIRRSKTRLAALLLAASVVSTASAAIAADATNGNRLAARWCAACHVVATNQRGTTGEAPPFATIARRSDFDAAKIARFLLDPHPKMPNMALTRVEAADLADYIASLRK
jgi:mono/diheme cytochrome c family protein